MDIGPVTEYGPYIADTTQTATFQQRRFSKAQTWYNKKLGTGKTITAKSFNQPIAKTHTTRKSEQHD